MKKPNQKGFSYEREIAKKLSLWLTQGKRDDVLWRTEGSGGRSTQEAKKGHYLLNSYGDIGVKDPSCQEAVDFISKVLIECKRGYSTRIDGLKLIDNPSKNHILKQWWNKAVIEMKECGRQYVWIIIKRNRNKSILMSSYSCETVLGFCMNNIPFITFYIEGEVVPVSIAPLEPLLKTQAYRFI